MDYNQTFQLSIYLHNDIHDNGMTLKEYADAVLVGSHPILGHEEFAYQFGTTEYNMQLVSNWAVENNLTIIMAESAIATIKIQGTLGHLKDLFSVTLQEITDNNRTYIKNTTPVIIPAEISPAVRDLFGFDQSFIATNHAVQHDASHPELGSSYGGSAVTPVQMCTAYNAPAGDGYGGCIGIFELTYSGSPEGWQQPDVTASFSRIGLTSPSITTVIVDGVTVNSTSTAESMLDIYCAGAAAPKAKIVYYIGQNGGSITDVINAAVNDTTNNPSVLSISWGLGDTTSYDTAFQSGTVKGITFFVSAGDSGAVNLSMAATVCSQYIVSAGGTNVTLNGSNALTAEVAWGDSAGTGQGSNGSNHNGATGGGHSSSVAVPSWQSGLTYTTTTGSNSSGLGTPTSLPYRGVPDWSAPADPNTGYQFYIGGTSSAQGSQVQYGGTSAAAPFLAGLWVRLTQLLGYRIPFNMTTFYANSTTLFNDVTTGNNRDGYSTGYVCTAGWDAVTGLGSPKADQIYKLFHTGQTYPKQNFGFRPNGPAYPRISTGARTD